MFRLPKSLTFGTAAERAARNCQAIRIAVDCHRAGREATDAEREILVRYVGWGDTAVRAHAMGPLAHKGDWRLRGDMATLYAEGYVLDEYLHGMCASTLNAHYTDPAIVHGMWDALYHLGLGAIDRPNILEPSCGVGHFFGAAPLNAGLLVGVEKDPATALIAGLIYPEATVKTCGFEEAELPSVFDVVIGNVPFGNFGVRDERYPKVVTHSIHNYFVCRALDLLRPGGIAALITSRYTLDSEEDRVRRWIAERADLVGAIRLPGDAFLENAGTQVTTDVLFLRARGRVTHGAEAGWIGLDEIEVGADAFGNGGFRGRVSSYYTARPEMALGVWTRDKLAYGREAVGLRTPAEETRPLLSRFERAVDRMPAMILTANRAQEVKEARLEAMGAPPVLTAAGLAAKGLLSAMQAVLRAERENADGPVVDRARAALRATYNRFRGKYGSLASAQGDVTTLRRESWWPLLRTLEDSAGQPAGPLVRRSVAAIDRAETKDPQGVLYQVLDETGKVDLPEIARRCGLTEGETAAALRGVLYQLGPGGPWELGHAYLSGAVRDKLKQARTWAAVDAAFEVNVADLEAVQPPPVRPEDICVPLGAPWVPARVYEDFLRHLFPHHDGYGATVEHLSEMGDWRIAVTNKAILYSIENTSALGTRRMTAVELIEHGLRLRMPVVYDRDPDGTSYKNSEETAAAVEKLAEIRRRWEGWVMRDPKRAEILAGIYNERFNGWREREWDGSHLTFPGMASEYKGRPLVLRKHQRAGALRIVERGEIDDSVFLTYRVGAGKTATTAIGIMKRLMLGLSRKAVIIVPKQTLGQWRKEFADTFPGHVHWILAATDGSFDGEARKEFLARAVTGDARVILMTYDQCRAIPLRPETFRAYLQREIDELESALSLRGEESGAAKTMEREMKKRMATLERFMVAQSERWDRLKKRYDSPVSWEDINADIIACDECHYLKAFPVATKMSGIAGMARSESQRAVDTTMKIHWVLSPDLFGQERPSGKAIGLTGTPITNTLCEAWVMMRIFQPKLLRKLGFWFFDDWARTFTTPTTEAEFDAVANLRMQTRLKFQNVPELLDALSTCWDRATDSPDMARPDVVGGRMEIVEVPGSEALRAYVASLAKRAEKVRKRLVHPSEDNMLKITHDGRLAALFNGPPSDTWTPGGPTPIDACIERLWDIHCHADRSRGLQLVFCDLFTPEQESDERDGYVLSDAEIFREQGLYGIIRGRLIAKGLQPSEIAYIHDAASDSDRARLFAAANAGTVRVLIGSTQKLGTGVNVQERAIACHHLTVPWRPDWLEQAEGRVRRPGNMHSQVHVITYPVTGSYAVVLWQFIEQKASFIRQIISRTYRNRSADDVGDIVIDAATAKAIAIGNPAVIAKIKGEMRLTQLTKSHANWRAENRRAELQAGKLPGEIESLRRSIAAIEGAIAVRDENPYRGFSARVIDGEGREEHLTDHTVALRRLRALGEGFLRTRQSSLKIGHYRGFTLHLRRRETYAVFTATAAGHTVEVHSFQISDGWVLLEDRLSALEIERQKLRADLYTKESRLASLTGDAPPWTERENARAVLGEYLAACRAMSRGGIVPAQIPDWADTVAPDLMAEHNRLCEEIAAAAKGEEKGEAEDTQET